jgi:hypothetical protein
MHCNNVKKYPFINGKSYGSVLVGTWGLKISTSKAVAVLFPPDA